MMPTEVILEPNWPNMIRWHANALMTHSFEAGARGPISTFMQMVGHLAQKDPEELNKIIAEFTDPLVIREAEDISEAPCPTCGYDPMDGHNWEVHNAEMRADERYQEEMAMEPPEMGWEDDAYEVDK